VFLSSVVAHELYVDAADAGDKQDLDRIRAAFQTAGLTVTPAFDDWCAAALMLARYRRLHGALDPRVHVNDILILLSAARIRARLLTWNMTDIRRWNALLPRSLRVAVTVPLQ